MPVNRLFIECLAIAAALIGTTEAFSTITTTTTRSSFAMQRPHAPKYTRSTALPATPMDLFDHHQSLLLLANTVAPPPELAGISYSKASYYTVLGLYLMSFPGLWSQIKRSTEAKVKRKTFVSKGEKNNNTGGTPGGMSLRQQAGEIMACKFFLFLALSALLPCRLTILSVHPTFLLLTHTHYI
jgi:Cofactor assembly of complex C subunit B